MVTEKDLMQQALEALEEIHPGNMTPMAEEAWNKAIAALRERLARPAQQPEQEPVAYRHLHEDGWEYYDAPVGDDCPGCIPLYTVPQPATECENCAALEEKLYEQAMKPAQQPRQWQGLTQEEIEAELYKFEAAYAWFQFAHAIEAKLREKNA